MSVRPSSYPAALDDLTAEQTDLGGEAVSSWALPSAVEAVQATLGTSPAGAFATVKARLEAIEGVTAPAEPAAITGVQGTDDTAILAALVAALDDLGLIVDETTTGE